MDDAESSFKTCFQFTLECKTKSKLLHVCAKPQEMWEVTQELQNAKIFVSEGEDLPFLRKQDTLQLAVEKSTANMTQIEFSKPSAVVYKSMSDSDLEEIQEEFNEMPPLRHNLTWDKRDIADTGRPEDDVLKLMKETEKIFSNLAKPFSQNKYNITVGLTAVEIQNGTNEDEHEDLLDDLQYKSRKLLNITVNGIPGVTATIQVSSVWGFWSYATNSKFVVGENSTNDLSVTCSSFASILSDK